MKNIQGDSFTVKDVVIKTEKGFDFYWDEIDAEVELFLNKIAEKGGVKIEDWGDLDLISDTREFIIKCLEERFDIVFYTQDELRGQIK